MENNLENNVDQENTPSKSSNILLVISVVFLLASIFAAFVIPNIGNASVSDEDLIDALVREAGYTAKKITIKETEAAKKASKALSVSDKYAKVTVTVVLEQELSELRYHILYDKLFGNVYKDHTQITKVWLYDSAGHDYSNTYWGEDGYWQRQNEEEKGVTIEYNGNFSIYMFTEEERGGAYAWFRGRVRNNTEKSVNHIKIEYEYPSGTKGFTFATKGYYPYEPIEPGETIDYIIQVPKENAEALKNCTLRIAD